MTLWKTRIAAALTIAATVAACSLDDLVPEGTLGIDDGASGGAKESYKVDSESEARIEIAETGASLTVPKGAVEHSVTIGVERPSDIKAIEFVETLKTVKAVASAPYVLTPHGTEFTKDLKLQIPVVANKGKELVAAYLKDENDREWKYLDTPVVEGDVATVTLKHFSVVVLLDRDRAGFDAPDAGSAAPPAQVDAGDAQPDAGSSEVDAGSASEPVDAGVAAVDAGTADAGGSSALDAGTHGAVDSGSAGSLDAASPNVTDAGTGSALDAGQAVDSGTAPVDSGTQILDTAVEVAPDAGDPNGGEDAGYDSGTVPDSGSDADPDCETLVCEPQQCGSVPNGCGGEMGCGECEYYGGVCNHDSHICEYIGQL